MQCPVNVYYNKELKVTMPITISTMDSLHTGIRDTIVYSMTKSVPQNAKYEKATVTKKGMFFGSEEVSIDKLTDVKNVERIDVYLSTPTGGGKRSRKSKSRKSRRR
jgi:hypothetical protein